MGEREADPGAGSAWSGQSVPSLAGQGTWSSGYSDPRPAATSAAITSTPMTTPRTIPRTRPAANVSKRESLPAASTLRHQSGAREDDADCRPTAGGAVHGQRSAQQQRSLAHAEQAQAGLGQALAPGHAAAVVLDGDTSEAALGYAQ